MSSANTSSGFYGLPAQIITTGGGAESTSVPLVVPPFTYNSGFPLPSPTLTAGSPLYVQVPPDIATGSMDWDGHPFRVRLAGKVHTGATATLTLYLTLGNSATNGGTGGNRISTGVTAAVTGDNNFVLDTDFIWDSTSAALNSNVSGNGAGSLIATAAGTSKAGVTQSTLIFTPFFLFSVANAANSVALAEFTIDRR